MGAGQWRPNEALSSQGGYGTRAESRSSTTPAAAKGLMESMTSAQSVPASSSAIAYFDSASDFEGLGAQQEQLWREADACTSSSSWMEDTLRPACPGLLALSEDRVREPRKRQPAPLKSKTVRRNLAAAFEAVAPKQTNKVITDKNGSGQPSTSATASVHRDCAGACAQILDKSHSGRFRETATANGIGHWVSLACNSEEPHLNSTRSDEVNESGPSSTCIGMLRPFKKACKDVCQKPHEPGSCQPHTPNRPQRCKSNRGYGQWLSYWLPRTKQ